MIHKDHNYGFSLVELVVVVSIMTILVGTLAPSLLIYIEKARTQRDAAAVSEVVEAARIAVNDSFVFSAIDVGDELIIGVDGSISDNLASGQVGVLASEVIITVPQVIWASPNKAQVIIILENIDEAPTFSVSTSSSDVKWKTAIEGIK